MQVWNVLHAARWKYRAQKSPKKSNRHLCTIAQICRAISSQLRHISTIGKKLLSINISSTCPHNMVNFSPCTNGWDRFGSLRHPCEFQRVSRLGSVTARHSSSGRQPNLRRWAQGATYIRQCGHHVGHWPTFQFLLLSFFPRLFSAVADWMSTILPHMMWP